MYKYMYYSTAHLDDKLSLQRFLLVAFSAEYMYIV